MGVKDIGSAARQPGAKAVFAHQDEAVATELARHSYSRERYEFLLRGLYTLMGILALALVINIYLALRPVETKYFATDSQGEIRSLTALDRPIQSKVEVINWAANAVADAFTFNFANYREQFEISKLNFTEAGWRGFQQALASHTILDDIVKNKYVASAVITAAPVVIQEGVAEGDRWGWKVEVPLVITYESASAHASSNFLAEVVVVRRPESENPRGLGIAQIIAK
jgi:intracellular multiplication protein IcmL